MSTEDQTKTCVKCRGQIVYGEPHIIKVGLAPNVREEFWCADCIDEYSAVMWPEDWPPREAKIYRTTQGNG
jgi:hypothetical protein